MHVDGKGRPRKDSDKLLALRKVGFQDKLIAMIRTTFQGKQYFYHKAVQHWLDISCSICLNDAALWYGNPY